MLKDLLDRARSRRAHSRSLAARLANLTVRDYQYLTEAEKRIRDGKLTPAELEKFVCWEDLAILACDNHERLTQATQEIEVLTTSLTTTQRLLEDERGTRVHGEVRHRYLTLEMETLRVGLAVAQTRETELEHTLSALRERNITAEAQWRSERDVMHREAENSARIQHELRSELVMALETHHPPTVGWRIELHNRGQELEATKRELLVARRLIDSLRKGESQPGLETREDSMGSVGRGFPGYTPSPAGSAVPETLFTAGFESVTAGFPSFPGVTPLPPATEPNRGQSSSAGLTNLGGSVEKEVGAHEDPALSRKPKDRVCRSEPQYVCRTRSTSCATGR